MANLYNENYTPRKTPWSSRIGTALSGIAAPFIEGGQENFIRQQALIQAQAEQDYKQWQDTQKMNQVQFGKEVYKIGDDGSLVKIGAVPKGSSVLSPMAMMTPQDKLKYEKDKKTASKQAELDIKQADLKKSLDTFFSVDDVLHSNRTKGGLGARIATGGKMWWEGIKQDNPLGVAVASHDAATKQLRVDIARRKDVGNLSEIEQEAAGMIIPTKWDSADVANLKRAYLKQLVSIKDSKDSSAVKDVIGKFMKESHYQAVKKSSNNDSAVLSKMGFDPNKYEIVR